MLATNELIPTTMFVPLSRFGPPESPKQVPDGFECNFRNCELIVSFEVISVVWPKNRVRSTGSTTENQPGAACRCPRRGRRRE